MLQVDTSFHVWLRQHYYLHKRKIWVVKITEARSRINVAFTVLRAALRLLGRSTDLQPERCSTVLSFPNFSVWCTSVQVSPLACYSTMLHPQDVNMKSSPFDSNTAKHQGVKELQKQNIRAILISAAGSAAQTWNIQSPGQILTALRFFALQIATGSTGSAADSESRQLAGNV